MQGHPRGARALWLLLALAAFSATTAPAPRTQAAAAKAMKSGGGTSAVPGSDPIGSAQRMKLTAYLRRVNGWVAATNVAANNLTCRSAGPDCGGKHTPQPHHDLIFLLASRVDFPSISGFPGMSLRECLWFQ